MFWTTVNDEGFRVYWHGEDNGDSIYGFSLQIPSINYIFGSFAALGAVADATRSGRGIGSGLAKRVRSLSRLRHLDTLFQERIQCHHNEVVSRSALRSEAFRSTFDKRTCKRAPSILDGRCFHEHHSSN